MLLKLLRLVAINGALLCGSMLIAVLLGEVLIRLAAPQQLIINRPDIWQPDPVLGHAHVPRSDTTVNTGERTVEFISDEHGFRVGRSPRPAGDYTVTILGDSFMEALQVEHEQSLAGLLEAELPPAIGGSVTVQNTGVGAWDPNQYLIQARKLVDSGQRPDLVLVSLYVGNDIVGDRRDSIPPRHPEETHSFRLPRSIGFRELVDSVLYPLNDTLETRSHLFIFLKTVLQTSLIKLGLSAVDFPAVFYTSTANGPHWAVTADICEEIATLFETHGIPTLFFLIPAPYQVDEEILDQFIAGFDIDMSQMELDQPSRILDREFQQRNIELIDTLPSLRAAYRSGTLPFGRVDRHFSPAGHEVVSELLIPIVTDTLATN